jgi:hypothetical protein
MTNYRKNLGQDPRIERWNLILKAIKMATDERVVAARSKDIDQRNYCTRLLRALRIELRELGKAIDGEQGKNLEIPVSSH